MPTAPDHVLDGHVVNQVRIMSEILPIDPIKDVIPSIGSMKETVSQQMVSSIDGSRPRCPVEPGFVSCRTDVPTVASGDINMRVVGHNNLINCLNVTARHGPRQSQQY